MRRAYIAAPPDVQVLEALENLSGSRGSHYCVVFLFSTRRNRRFEMRRLRFRTLLRF
jgi:hypothetical protein